MEYNPELINDLIPWLLPAAIALLAMGIVMGIVRRISGRLVAKRQQNAREIRMITNAVQWMLMAFILMTLLEVLNVPLGNVWTAISTVLALVAIGFFAVWSVLSHMTASLVLFFQRPFRAGEILQFGDEEYVGRVRKTGLFFTTVEDRDGGISHIPNNLLFQRRFRVTRDWPKTLEE